MGRPPSRRLVPTPTTDPATLRDWGLPDPGSGKGARGRASGRDVAVVEAGVERVAEEHVALELGGGLAELRTALQAWNDDPGTLVDYRYEGATDATSEVPARRTLRASMSRSSGLGCACRACGNASPVMVAWTAPLVCSASHVAAGVSPAVDDGILPSGLAANLMDASKIS